MTNILAAADGPTPRVGWVGGECAWVGGCVRTRVRVRVRVCVCESVCGRVSEEGDGSEACLVVGPHGRADHKHLGSSRRANTKGRLGRVTVCVRVWVGVCECVRTRVRVRACVGGWVVGGWAGQRGGTRERSPSCSRAPRESRSQTSWRQQTGQHQGSAAHTERESVGVCMCVCVCIGTGTRASARRNNAL